MQRHVNSKFFVSCGVYAKFLHFRLVHFHRNYDDYTTCKMLSDDLNEYVKQSVPVHQKKCEEMMKTLNITLKPGTTQPSNIQNPQELLKSKKCEGVCKNDLLLENLDKFFNSMKKRPSLTINKASLKNNSIQPDTLVGMQVDESGDLIFDMNIKRNRTLNLNTPNNQPGTSGIQRLNCNAAATEGRASIPNFKNNNFRPAETVTSNTFNPYGGVKRRTDDTAANNYHKRSTYMPKLDPENIEPNAFAVKNNFITATEELNIQYNKKYGAGNQNDNTAYNVNPNGGLRRSLGGRRTVGQKFVPPFANQQNNMVNSNQTNENSTIDEIEMNHPRLKNVDPKMIEAIMNEIIDQCDSVG